MSVSPTDEPAGNTQPSSFFSIVTGLGADAALIDDGTTDGVVPLCALLPQADSSTPTTTTAGNTPTLIRMSAQYAQHNATA